MGEYGGGVWRCEEVSPHTSIPHRGHGRTEVAALVVVRATGMGKWMVVM